MAPATRTRIEHALAVGRGVVAVVSVAALSIDPSAPSLVRGGVSELLAAYVTFAATVVVLARAAPAYLVGAALGIHVIDVAWAGVIASFNHQAAMAFGIVLVFVVLAAAVRWGLPSALITGGVVIAMFLAATGMARQETLLTAGTFLKTGYLVALTLMAGHLAAAVRTYLAERHTVEQMLAGIAVVPVYADALRLCVEPCMARVAASHAVLVVQSTLGGRSHLWRFDRGTNGVVGRPVLEELAPGEAPIVLARPPRPVAAWQVWQRRDGRFSGRGTAAPEGPTVRFDGSFARPLLDRHRVTSVLGADVTVGGEWRARLLLLEPRQPSSASLGFLSDVVSRVAPALHHRYLVARIRSKVNASERARLARELHDGPLQTLIGLEIEAEVLRRNAEKMPLPEPLIRQLRDQLRLTIADARDLMLRLKPTAVTGTDVLRAIAELAGRLRREAGIEVRVVSSSAALACSPRTCQHLVHIVQEALANVRKHSGARSVTITVSENARSGRLVIADDGRGFPFSGRLTLDRLEATDLGPAVIKERVRAIRGRLVIGSTPGSGAEIDVEWPREPYA